MVTNVIFGTLLALTSLTAFAGSPRPLKASGGYFRDKDGAIVVLRGVNLGANAKKPPFIPLAGKGTEPDVSKLDQLAQWGMNVIRLPFIWEAYEPVRGQYNEEYLRKITAIIDAAWERGIYTMVDLHQDAYSRHLGSGCGDGFPAWAVEENDRLKISDTAEPANCGPQWAGITGTNLSMHSNFGSFYANKNGVRSAYLALWKRLAAHFKSHQGVIGYDLLNEPWGNEKEEIYPLYRDATKAVRSEDPDAIVFLAPHVSTVFGKWETALPKPEFENAAYSPHFYELSAATFGVWNPEDPSAENLAYKNMKKTAKKWDAPLFVAEFGGIASVKNVDAYIGYQYDLLNESFASSAQWNYTPEWNPKDKDGWNSEDLSIVDENGKLRPNFKPRPYATRIAGSPHSQKTLKNGKNGKMIALAWHNSPSLGATEFFVPAPADGSVPKFRVTGDHVSCVYIRARQKFSCQSRSVGFKTLQVVAEP